MDLILPNKSSSRAGRFKKKLVTEEILLSEAQPIQVKVAPFLELLASGKLTQVDFTACYLLTYLSQRFPGTWLGSKKASQKEMGLSWRDLPFVFEHNILRRLENVASIYDIFAGFALKSTPLAVNRAILEWSKGIYGLELMFRIPQPSEVLTQQKTGRRCVTTIIDHRLSKYILGERDALSFTMHDLIHADHFYHHNECYQGQLGFYGLLDKSINYFDLSHAAFSSEFEYLIADMNAYAIHLLKCLKSAMIHYFSEDYFNGWCADLDPPLGLYALITPAYNPEVMDSELLVWLEKFRQS
jgi:hypothetical protein